MKKKLVFETEKQLVGFIAEYMITCKGFNPEDMTCQEFLITPSDVIDFIYEFVTENKIVKIKK